MILVYLGRWSYGRFQDDKNIFYKMKSDLTTRTWQDNIWCPIIIILFCTSYGCSSWVRGSRLLLLSSHGSPISPLGCALSAYLLWGHTLVLGLPGYTLYNVRLKADLLAGRVLHKRDFNYAHPVCDKGAIGSAPQLRNNPLHNRNGVTGPFFHEKEVTTWSIVK